MPVVSYCDIPQDLTEGHYLSEFPCGCYVEFYLGASILMHSISPLDAYLSAKYPELRGTTFLIEIDY